MKTLVECKHEYLIEDVEVINMYEYKLEKFRVVRIRCEDCYSYGAVTEVWSPADSEWLYYDESWED